MRIDTRPIQWVGVAVLIGWTALLAFGLPRVAEALPTGSTVAAGTAVVIGTTGITPSTGWEVDSQAPLPVLRKDGSQVNVFPAGPATGDAASIIGATLDGLRADTATGWQIGDPQPFTTADGREGLYAVSVTPTQFEIDVVVVKDGTSQAAGAYGSATALTTGQDEILEMLKTMTNEGAGA